MYLTTFNFIQRLDDHVSESSFAESSYAKGCSKWCYCTGSASYNGFPLESILTDKRTALGEAVNVGNRSVVSMLLKNGAKINSCGGSVSDEPFFLAVGGRWTAIVRLLLENGANVNHFIANEYKSPVYIAVCNGDIETTKVLLERKPDLDIKDSLSQETPLLAAVNCQSIEMAKLLLDHGANIDVPDRNGRNAIDIAIRNRDSRVVESLLLFRPGASPKTRHFIKIY
jgi:ankyrin repeat protein